MRRPAVLALLLLAGCDGGVAGGPAQPLPPALAADSYVTGNILVIADFSNDDDFSHYFMDEIEDGLAACARGRHPLGLRLRIDRLDRANRLLALFGARHELRAVATFVDRENHNAVVGRYPITVRAPSTGGVGGVMDNRLRVVGAAWTEELCKQAFRPTQAAGGP